MCARELLVPAPPDISLDTSQAHGTPELRLAKEAAEDFKEWEKKFQGQAGVLQLGLSLDLKPRSLAALQEAAVSRGTQILQ